MSAQGDTADRPPRGFGWWRRWPSWSGVAAASGLAVFAAAIVPRAFGGPYLFALPGNPESTFGEHWLSRLNPDLVTWVSLAAAVTTLAAVVLMASGTGGTRRLPLLVVGWVMALFLVLVLPGPQSLDGIPVFGLLNLKRLAVPTVVLVALRYVGFALAGATLAYARRSRGSCMHCGRRHGVPTWSRERWARIGVVSAILAFVCPLGYAVIRVLWATGVPVGTTREFLREIDDANPGHQTRILEIVLATMAVGGAVLCLGLTRPWSRRWPPWVPGLAGRPVPRWFPVGLGATCGAGLFGYSVLFVPGLVEFALGRPVDNLQSEHETTWLSQLPALSIFVWSVCVLVAVVAFHYRTRTSCRVCGHG